MRKPQTKAGRLLLRHNNEGVDFSNTYLAASILDIEDEARYSLAVHLLDWVRSNTVLVDAEEPKERFVHADDLIWKLLGITD